TTRRIAGKETSKESSAIDITSPLYLHPSEGSLVVSEKLQGIANYRFWKRAMEIALAARRKLGFVTGVVVRDKEDPKKQELWDTCNNVVISWLHTAVSDTIKKSVLYSNSVRDIWLQLERRFTVSNDTLKYRISKALYDIKQNETSINDYYTRLCVLWEELENLNDYPVITQMTPKVRAYIDAIRKQQEEQQLFQFLNRLDDDYSSQRTCAQLQQVEAQRQMFSATEAGEESFAMNSKGVKWGDAQVTGGKKGVFEEYCKVCGKRNHTATKCCYVKGFPEGHPKLKGKKEGGSRQNWNKGNSGIRGGSFKGKTTANATTQQEEKDPMLAFTPHVVQ
ncbi:Protein SlyX-like protein, partial [Bienertia sinuspersici]